MQIASEIDGKTPEDIAEYSKVFWERYTELNDWEKIIKNIERGEQKIQRQADIMAAIRNKIERYKNPWQELKVRLGAVCVACRSSSAIRVWQAEWVGWWWACTDGQRLHRCFTYMAHAVDRPDGVCRGIYRAYAA